GACPPSKGRAHVQCAHASTQVIRVGHASIVLAILAASFCMAKLLLSNTAQQMPASFVDVAARAGLTAKNYSGGEIKKKYIVEMNGSGLGFIDYDRDGYPDLFIVNGKPSNADNSSPPATNHIYRNNRDGTFKDVTQAAGLVSSGWGQGVAMSVGPEEGLKRMAALAPSLDQYYLFHAARRPSSASGP